MESILGQPRGKKNFKRIDKRVVAFVKNFKRKYKNMTDQEFKKWLER